MEKLKELDLKKKQIEEEIESLLSVLNADGQPGLKESLIDKEGFPRADVDVYAVRGARHRIACLKTDYQQVEAEIEKALHELHKTSCISVPSSSRPSDHENCLDAFATVGEVFPASPAEAAGLRPGDLVIRFGSLSQNTYSAAQCFAQLPNVVKEGVSIQLCVLRDKKFLDLRLAPHRWEGQGLLGCSLKPIVKNC